MRFWLREVAGWVLVLSDRHMIFEAGSLVLIGIFLFRGGIHLLKVAVAARICTQTQEQLVKGTGRQRAGRMPPPARRPAAGWGP